MSKIILLVLLMYGISFSWDTFTKSGRFRDSCKVDSLANACLIRTDSNGKFQKGDSARSAWKADTTIKAHYADTAAIAGMIHHGVSPGTIPGALNDSQFTNTIATFTDTAITITGIDSDTLIPLNQTNRAWTALTVAVNGDVYAAVTNGYGDAGVYERSGGTGDFSLLQAADLPWNGLTSKSNGDVFAVIGFYDYCKQTGGTGTFDRQWSSAIGWQGMTSAPNGDVYATVPGTGANGDIYRFPGGAVPKEALSQTKRNWWGMCCDSSGNLYAVVNGGDVYLRPYGGSTFAALGQTSRLWTGICNAPNGDIYAATQVGGVFRRKAGIGDFVYIFGDTTVAWYDVAADADGNIYACVYGGDIYKYYPAENTAALRIVRGGMECERKAVFNDDVVMTGISMNSGDTALILGPGGTIYSRTLSSLVLDSVRACHIADTAGRAGYADSSSVFVRALTEDLLLWFGEKYPGDGLNINSCYDLGYNHHGYAGLSWMGDRFLLRPPIGSAGQLIFDYGNTAWVMRKHNDDSLIISYTDVADANDSSTTLQDTIALTITKTGIRFADSSRACHVADTASKAGVADGVVSVLTRNKTNGNVDFTIPGELYQEVNADAYSAYYDTCVVDYGDFVQHTYYGNLLETVGGKRDISIGDSLHVTAAACSVAVAHDATVNAGGEMHLVSSSNLFLNTPASIRLNTTYGVYISGLKSGTSQANASANANELWIKTTDSTLHIGF
jgi:hypothetical protein